MPVSLDKAPPAKPCGCPEDASGVVVSNGVEISGHLTECEAVRPCRYMWLENHADETSMRSGTLALYAVNWALDFGSPDFGPSLEIRTWRETFTVKVEHLGTDENDYARYLLSVPGECIVATVDLRS